MKSSGTRVKNILIVDDEPAICEVCLRTLTNLGYHTDIAPNGAIAEKMLVKRDYDLLLIDIRTPVLNGAELYHCITEKYPRLADRVVFTTGDVVSRDTQHFLGQSGQPFLPKPFTPDELSNMVRDTLKQIEKSV